MFIVFVFTFGDSCPVADYRVGIVGGYFFQVPAVPLAVLVAHACGQL